MCQRTNRINFISYFERKMFIFQVPTSFSFEILSCICQQQIILISHDNKNCFDIFFSLQKLEALDFITMLSQWSSFSSQKVQIRFFFAPSLDFPPIFIPAFFLKKVSHSPNPVCCCPRGQMLF